MRERYTRDRLQTFGLLLIVAVLIHAAYTFYVRPVANGWITAERAKQAADPAYKPERSIWVILHDPEQEVIQLRLVLRNMRVHQFRKQLGAVGQAVTALREQAKPPGGGQEAGFGVPAAFIQHAGRRDKIRDVRPGPGTAWHPGVGGAESRQVAAVQRKDIAGIAIQ